MFVDQHRVQAVKPRTMIEVSPISGDDQPSMNEKSKVADFFAPDVFQTVLHDPTTARRFRSYCESSACVENVDFLEKVRSGVLCSRLELPKLHHKASLCSHRRCRSISTINFLIKLQGYCPKFNQLSQRQPRQRQSTYRKPSRRV